MSCSTADNTPTSPNRCRVLRCPSRCSPRSDAFAQRTLTSLIGACISRMAAAFSEHRPDVVVVQGDTATAGAIALAGFTARSLSCMSKPVFAPVT
ncbi:MAG: UDP-N-acetylglucosamine 2-epimerase [Pirellulales bacterium]